MALKTMKMRGQAHIAFRDVQASTQAMRALQGFDFFGKEMRVAYAKGKTNSVAMLDGTYKMPVPIQTSTATAQTTLQQAVFGGAPSGLSDKTEPAKSLAVSKANGTDTAHSPQGTKRPREEDEEDEDVPMDEEDQQSDVSMEEGSSSESEND